MFITMPQIEISETGPSFGMSSEDNIKVQHHKPLRRNPCTTHTWQCSLMGPLLQQHHKH